MGESTHHDDSHVIVYFNTLRLSFLTVIIFKHFNTWQKYGGEEGEQVAILHP